MGPVMAGGLMKYIAQILPHTNSPDIGIVHHGCDCRVVLTSRGEYDSFIDAQAAALVGTVVPDLCPDSVPVGRPIYHAASGDLVGVINGDKFIPINR
jgi:hypothetical protein